MTPGSGGRLRRWDAAVVRALGLWLARLDARGLAVRARYEGLRHRWRPPASATAGGGLRAGRREVALGVVAVLVLVVGVVGAATHRSGPHAPAGPVPTAPGPEPGADRVPVLGPRPGQPVADYVAGAARRLRDLVLAHPDRDTVALVSFSREVSADAAGRLLRPLPSSTAFADAGTGGLTGVPGAAATGLRGISAPGDVARSAPPALRAVARQLLAAATELEQLAGRVTPGQPVLPEQQAAQRRLARGYRTQAEVLLRGACLVGAVVHGTPRELAAVAARRGVRAVDPAPAGVPESRLDVHPLLPAAARG